MNPNQIQQELADAGDSLTGEIATDMLTRQVYATDASVYQQLPVAVAFPGDEQDIAILIEAARRTGSHLIPRTAGTSLAGQVVGSGIVVDVSRHLNRILDIDQARGRVRVQPGVIRDELNRALSGSGKFFAPETSTSNRAMLGGMVGNNSCGANSIVYGSTRDHLASLRGRLADGQAAEFSDCDPRQTEALGPGPAERAADRITRDMLQLLANPENQLSIREGFPAAGVTRRNTGYALDQLLDCQPFTENGPPFNLCRLLAGSEGTLFFATEIEVRLEPDPPSRSAFYCPHFDSVEEALRAVLPIMQHPVFQCELIDHRILAGLARNPGLQPALNLFDRRAVAVLLVEIRDRHDAGIRQQGRQLQAALQDLRLGYHHPLLAGPDVAAVRQVRSAGLGLAGNVIGDAKPVTIIEDGAVAIEDLPDYIGDVDRLLAEKYSIECVHYGHAGAGELHLRPVLNMKTAEGVRMFRSIADDVAGLILKYRGSLSGEHGDGRLRGHWIGKVIGPSNLELLHQVKRIWDPDNLLNPGKIVNTPEPDRDLRFAAGDPEDPETVLDFSASGGIRRAAEMCNGVGACRKLATAGGTMCPSYMVTRDEIHSTRARANIVRQVLSEPEGPGGQLADPRIHQAMDLCLSCKACRAECPANVDVARLKAEFQQAWYDRHGWPWRERMTGRLDQLLPRLACLAPLLNPLIGTRIGRAVVGGMTGMHWQRSWPRVRRVSWQRWFQRRQRGRAKPAMRRGPVVWMFCDEFTNWLDVEVGQAAVELLERLGYQVRMVENQASGRAAISVGMLRRARQLAEANVAIIEACLGHDEDVVVGLEPSALLTLRDEYPDLMPASRREAARRVAARTLLIDEFVSREMESGRITPAAFTRQPCSIRLHGHCHQRALASLKPSIRMLQLPVAYRVGIIPAGCCGMAGPFGFQKEHFDLSMQIGELQLFPAIRRESAGTIIAAAGTSCRHQILDGTGRRALHPVQVLRQALCEAPRDEPVAGDLP